MIAMVLRTNELARREGRQVLFAPEPMRLTIGPADASCADGHTLRLSLQCSIGTRSQAADRQMFVEMLMSDREAVTLNDLAAHLRPAMQSTAAEEASAAEAVSDAGRNALLTKITKSLDSVAFAAGFVVLPPFQFDLSSPSLQLKAQEAAERARMADRSAGQLQQVRHAAEMLREFQSLRADAPQVPAGEMLERIAAADRVAVLQSTLAARASTAKTSSIIAVAATQWLRIDPAAPPVSYSVPESLGPLRSVRVATIDGQTRLLLGARNGVWVVDPSGEMTSIAYADASLKSPLGFNAAVALANGSICATHAEGGLVIWARETTAKPMGIVSRGNGVCRTVHCLDATRAIAASDASIILSTGERFDSISRKPIVDLLPTDNAILIVHDDGAIGSLDRRSLSIAPIAHFGGYVSAAAALPWVDEPRLLLARDNGAIDCVGLHDSLVTRFQTGNPGAVKSIDATDGTVIALSNDRQRLIAWSPADGQNRTVDLHLTSITHHRIGDVILLPPA